MEQNQKTLEFLKIIQTNSETNSITKIIEEILENPLVYNFQLFLNEPNVQLVFIFHLILINKVKQISK